MPTDTALDGSSAVSILALLPSRVGPNRGTGGAMRVDHSPGCSSSYTSVAYSSYLLLWPCDAPALLPWSIDLRMYEVVQLSQLSVSLARNVGDVAVVGRECNALPFLCVDCGRFWSILLCHLVCGLFRYLIARVLWS